jgi:kynurenine formamidase
VSEPSNWGRWGSDDERGAANLLTGERVLEACAAPTRGEVFNLGIQVRAGAPVVGRRTPPVHLMLADGGDYAALGREDWGTADDYLFMAAGGSSHIDALAHVWSGGAMYNGHSFREVRSSGAQRCGIEKTGGLVCRALLVDVVDAELPSDGGVRPEFLDAYLAERGLAPRPGDALLLRTGWMEAALRGEEADRAFPVLHLDAAEWIARHDIVLIGADNPAVEETGRRGVLPPLHKIVMRDLGVYIMEMLDLSAPAAAGVDSGLLIVAPLLITHGVNSPVNPLLVA